MAAAPAVPPFDPATATVQTHQGFVLSPELQKNRATYRNNKDIFGIHPPPEEELAAEQLTAAK